MRERVILAMHKVWANRCEEACRDVEYGVATGIAPNLEKARFIQIARSKSEPHMIVGIWHVRPLGHGEHEIMNEQLFSPPVHKGTLRKFYQLLIENTSKLLWVHEAMEMDAIR